MSLLYQHYYYCICLMVRLLGSKKGRPKVIYFLNFFFDWLMSAEGRGLVISWFQGLQTYTYEYCKKQILLEHFFEKSHLSFLVSGISVTATESLWVLPRLKVETATVEYSCCCCRRRPSSGLRRTRVRSSIESRQPWLGVLRTTYVVVVVIVVVRKESDCCSGRGGKKSWKHGH